MSKFCVIGDKSTNLACQRTWFESQPDAEAHAARLLQSKGDYHSKLFVVEVVSAIELQAAPGRRLSARELSLLLKELK